MGHTPALRAFSHFAAPFLIVPLSSLSSPPGLLQPWSLAELGSSELLPGAGAGVWHSAGSPGGPCGGTGAGKLLLEGKGEAGLGSDSASQP